MAPTQLLAIQTQRYTYIHFPGECDDPKGRVVTQQVDKSEVVSLSDLLSISGLSTTTNHSPPPPTEPAADHVESRRAESCNTAAASNATSVNGTPEQQNPTQNTILEQQQQQHISDHEDIVNNVGLLVANSEDEKNVNNEKTHAGAEDGKYGDGNISEVDHGDVGEHGEGNTVLLTEEHDVSTGVTTISMTVTTTVDTLATEGTGIDKPDTGTEDTPAGTDNDQLSTLDSFGETIIPGVGTDNILSTAGVCRVDEYDTDNTLVAENTLMDSDNTAVDELSIRRPTQDTIVTGILLVDNNDIGVEKAVTGTEDTPIVIEGNGMDKPVISIADTLGTENTGNDNDKPVTCTDDTQGTADTEKDKTHGFGTVTRVQSSPTTIAENIDIESTSHHVPMDSPTSIKKDARSIRGFS